MDKNEAERLYADAGKLFAAGELQQAATILETLIAAFPASGQLLLAYARCQRGLGNIEEAHLACSKIELHGLNVSSDALHALEASLRELPPTKKRSMATPVVAGGIALAIVVVAVGIFGPIYRAAHRPAMPTSPPPSSETGPNNPTDPHPKSVPASPSDSVDGEVVFRVVVPAGTQGQALWRYTFTDPGPDWMKPEYPAGSWYSGEAPFTTDKRPREAKGTLWETRDVWLRRYITVSETDRWDLVLWGRHDDGMQVYVNGTLGGSENEWTPVYNFMPLNNVPDAGDSLLAVHCENTGGAGYLDMGLAENPCLDLPTTGVETAPQFAPFTDAVQLFMREHCIPAGVLAVMKGQKIVVNRAFGWKDRNKTTPLQPNAMMRLASIDKPVIKAAIVQLVALGAQLPRTYETLQMQTKVLPLLAAYGIHPKNGIPPDHRWNDVTVQHLAEHQSGVHDVIWGDPVREFLGLEGPVGPRDSAIYMISHPLDFDPGSKNVYSNTGYSLLRYIVHLVTGNYLDFLQSQIYGPYGGTEVCWLEEDPAKRDPSEPFYVIPDDLLGKRLWEGNIAVICSATAYVKYLRGYHMGLGTPLVDPVTRKWAAVPDNGIGVFFGGMPGTSTAIVQRRFDEVSFAVFFNRNVKDMPLLTDRLNLIADSLRGA